MTDFRFTLHAKKQLIEIWDYSVRHWGQPRADRYLRAFNEAIELVVASKRRSRRCEQYGAGMTFIRSGSHNIYLRYDPDADRYWVLGILHQRMDQARHLRTLGGE